jgi:hypothetical protein
MLTKDQCALLKAQAQANLKQEKYRLELAKAIVEDVISMQSAFQKFDLMQYNQTKGE